MGLIEIKMLDRNIIEAELEKIVSSASRFIPSLSEIRVFGSYNNGNWNPEKSDIDVFIEVGDEYYCVMKDMQHFSDYTQIESKQRQEIRAELTNSLTEECKKAIEIHILTKKDVKRLWNYEERNKGPLGKNMKAGRLLYSSKSKRRNRLWEIFQKKLLEKIIKQREYDGLFSKYWVRHAGRADIDYIEGFNKILRTYSYYSIDGKRVF